MCPKLPYRLWARARTRSKTRSVDAVAALSGGRAPGGHVRVAEGPGPLAEGDIGGDDAARGGFVVVSGGP
jgi:hypothetical protein